MKDKENNEKADGESDRTKAVVREKPPSAIIGDEKGQPEEYPTQCRIEKTAAQHHVHEAIAEHAVRDGEGRREWRQFRNERNERSFVRVKGAEKKGERSHHKDPAETGIDNQSRLRLVHIPSAELYSLFDFDDGQREVDVQQNRESRPVVFW